MQSGTQRVFEFGSFQLDAAGHVLHRNGKRVPLAPKLLETLLVLVEKRGQVVNKDELLQRVWPDTFVEETNLARNVSQLRKVLEYDRNGRAMIETIPTRGYVFVGEVRERSGREAGETAALSASQPGATTAGTNNAVADLASPDRLRAQARSRTGRWYGVASLAVIIIVAAIAITAHRAPVPLVSSIRLPNVNFTRLTTMGTARLASISPDGHYVAYVAEDMGKQAIYVLQVATQSLLAVTRPAEVVCCSIAFSPGGEYIYYVASPNLDDTYRNLYRVPLLGGVVRRIAQDVDSPVGISPDGRSVAFRRYKPGTGESLLMIADVEAAHERVLSKRRSPEFYSGPPAWSPDGREIALCIATIGVLRGKVAVLAADGSRGEKEIISTDSLRFEQLAGLRDYSGWVVAATDRQSATQLWLLSKQGKLRRITNDAESYIDLALNSASTALVAVAQQTSAALWLAPAATTGSPRQIIASVNIAPDAAKVLWTRDDKLIFSSRSGGNAGLWMMDADGGNPHPLATDTGSYSSAAVIPDGHRLVFVSEQGEGSNIWSMDIDGSNLFRLTRGNSDYGPSVSPDGKWVIFYSRRTGGPTLWRVPTVGGEEVQINGEYGICHSISPDGRYIAFGYLTASHEMQVGIMPFAGGKPLKRFPIANPSTVGWTPDGTGLTYVAPRGEQAQVWLQPLDGRAPTALAHLEHAEILDYALSPDGKQIVIAGGRNVSDVVLLNLR